MSYSNKSLAQTFSENELRARRFSTISLCVLALLTVSNVYFGISWRRSEIKAKQTILSLDSARAALDIQSREMQNIIKTYAVNQSRADSLVAIVRKLEPPASPNPPLAGQTTSLDTRITKKRRRIWLDSVLNAPNVTVYLQYIDSYAGAVDSAMNILKAEGYHIPGKERMRQANFASAVKYFNPGDRAIAQRIALLLSTRISRLKRVVRIVSQNNMAAPQGQIEVWLGEVQRQDADQIINRITQRVDK